MCIAVRDLHTRWQEREQGKKVEKVKVCGISNAVTASRDSDVGVVSGRCLQQAAATASPGGGAAFLTRPLSSQHGVSAVEGSTMCPPQ